MPHCRHCGNSFSFGSSFFPPLAPTANGPISSLVANFQGNELDNIESFGVEPFMYTKAWEEPQKYFDTCYNCGSSAIAW